MTAISEDLEWLETDGLGGYAMGTSALVRTRRYHGLLLCAERPPIGRAMLINGLEAWIESPRGRFALSAQRYLPDVIHPDGLQRLCAFSIDPWPRWHFELWPGAIVEQELFVRRGLPLTVLSWLSSTPLPEATLYVRLLCSGRDFHALHRENSSFRFEPRLEGERLSLEPYPDRARAHLWFSGRYEQAPSWYRQFLYTEERARGLDCVEDLASPGVFSWRLDQGSRAELILAADSEQTRLLPSSGAAELASELRRAERDRRAEFAAPLARAADQYLVRGSNGVGLIAGYPWFGEWGRDTFIALRGLCLATGRLAEARALLLEWAGAVSRGMLPNRLSEQGGKPEYNSVDAALWYVVVAGELLAHPEARSVLSTDDRQLLHHAIAEILDGHLAGSRHRIGVDDDGLLRAGEPGLQLTWMDAKVGDRVITPRIGKPVEIQALWVNALAVGEKLGLGGEYAAVRRRAEQTFGERFWYAAGEHLYDVVDVEHARGTVDSSLRPNQLFALGGLPIALISGERARRAVEVVVEQLWTPMGLRSLSPGHPAYAGRYQGGPRERDSIYHQGVVWPWLTGALIDAWLATHPGDEDTARERFFEPLEAGLERAGIGHVSEIADGDPPHTPRGCPFQAWSLGELIRTHAHLHPASECASSQR